MPWFMVVTDELEYVTNGRCADEEMQYLQPLPNNWQRVFTEDPAPNPETHEAVSDAEGNLSVVRRVPTLEEIKTKAKAEIDQAAGRARSRYVTVVAMQGTSYQEKETECVRFLTTPGQEITPEGFPYLYRRQKRGKDPQAEAQEVVMNGHAWRHKDAEIDDLRLAGKEQVDAAIDENEALAAVLVTRAALSEV